MAITPAVMEMAGREMMRQGQSVWRIVVTGGKLELRPIAYWDVYGGTDPQEWTYQITESGPSDTTTRSVTAAAVCHLRYGSSPADPWVGVSPLGRASQTSALAGALEERLSQEISGPVGHVIPLPSGQRAQLREDLKKMRGGVALVDSVAEWADAGQRRPSGDWTQRRIGADPPTELIALRQQVTASVLDACGVPASLAGAASDGTAQRESFRRFAAWVGLRSIRLVRQRPSWAKFSLYKAGAERHGH